MASVESITGETVVQFMEDIIFFAKFYWMHRDYL
jgi:hypothetical protein